MDYKLRKEQKELKFGWRSVPLRITRRIEDEFEEILRAEESMKKLVGHHFRNKDGFRVELTERGYKEFLDACSRVLAGHGPGPGASKEIHNWDSEKMELLLSTIDLLPEIIYEMEPNGIEKDNDKRWKKPDTTGYRYYEAPIEILGKKYVVNLAIELKNGGAKKEYYFHTLRESEAILMIEMIELSPRL